MRWVEGGRVLIRAKAPVAEVRRSDRDGSSVSVVGKWPV